MESVCLCICIYYMKKNFFFTIIFFASIHCNSSSGSKEKVFASNHQQIKDTGVFSFEKNTIHVLVALCDNKYQGIVPVPAGIGNGQDPKNNLYWGCAFGISSYFKKSKEWKLIDKRKQNNLKLERGIFRHTTKNYYLVADAYDGRFIKQCTSDFLNSCAGKEKDTVQIGNITLGINGNARLIAYIGHNGLMDFQLDESFENADGQSRDCIILACKSKPYFQEYIKTAKAFPLLWTTGLMAPEAYTLHDALSAYIHHEPNEIIRQKAALAYSRFQKCGVHAAHNLLVQGW